MREKCSKGYLFFILSVVDLLNKGTSKIASVFPVYHDFLLALIFYFLNTEN